MLGKEGLDVLTCRGQVQGPRGPYSAQASVCPGQGVALVVTTTMGEEHSGAS